jgi:osmoprotectant transport system permease protein
MRRLIRDLALALLSLTGVLAMLAAGFLRLAPNRLLSGQAIMLWQTAPRGASLGLMLAWLALLAGSLLPPHRWLSLLGALLAGLLLIGMPALAGLAAHDLALHAATQARVQLGAGFWLMTLAAALLMLDRLRRLDLHRGIRLLWPLIVLTALVALALAGVFDALALSREYIIQREPFQQALVRHLLLVLMALVSALLIGVPLALWAHRRARFAGALLGTLNLLQTVPSIALFALLIGPLAWLAQHAAWLQARGIGGTGMAPAVIALCVYALLPVVRSVLSGLDSVPPAALDASRGMGMGRGQILRDVQLPLAWPILLAGLRIVTVQSIGLAAVAALIGAGGLGRFIFLGLGQGANDLVLLGTLAIIALALAADALFQGLQVLTERRA